MLSYIICEDFPKPYLVSSVAKFCPTLVTPWTVAHQAPLFMGFSRWEYWSGLPFLSSEDLPNPGIEPTSPALQADSLSLSHWGKPMFSHSGGIVLYFCKSTSALIVSWILICFRCVPWCYITHHVSSGKLHHTLTGEWKWKRQLKVLSLCIARQQTTFWCRLLLPWWGAEKWDLEGIMQSPKWMGRTRVTRFLASFLTKPVVMDHILAA